MNIQSSRITKSVILNILMPGCGNLYAGHAALYIAPIIIMLFLYYLVGYLGFLSNVYINLFSWVVIIGYIVFSVVYVAYLAKNNYRKMWYGKWYVQAIWVIAILLFTTFKPKNEEIGYSVYRIHSDKLEPTIRKGEYIISNTYAYRSNQYPEVGDIVIVNSSSPRIFGIYRVSSEFDGNVYIESSLIGSSAEKSFENSVSKESIAGKVTNIYFSNNINRIGAKL